MKILKIHIRNLNSLKGDFNIDFTSGALAHTGIFAITGATGAGKTTVLDSITLALYGKVARNKDVKEVMSNGTTESHAEVEFEVFAQRYLASWHIHRARKKISGKIGTPKRELAQWNEETASYEIIAEKIKEVDAQVERISGLDYHRFTRSVLLSQGDFAAFLRADVRERSDLLERITGTEIYSQLSKAAFERYRLEKGRLENLQAQLQQLGVYEQEAIDEQQLQSLKSTSDTHAQALNKIRQALQALSRWRESTAKKEQLLAQQIALKEQIDQFKDQALLLERSKRLSPLDEDLKELQRTQKAHNDSEAKLKALTHTITQSIAKEKHEKTRFEASVSAQKLFEKEQNQKEALFRQLDQLYTQKQHVEEDVALSAKDKQQLIEQLKHIKTEQSNNEKELQSLQSSLQSKRTWLADHAQLADLESKLASIGELRNQWLQVEELKNKNEQAATTLQKELEQADEQVQSKQADYEQHLAVLAGLETDYTASLPAAFREKKELKAFQQALQSLQDKVQQTRELYLLDESYAALLKEQQQHEDRLAILYAQQQDLTKQLLSSMDQLDLYQAELDYKQEIYRQQQLIANYTQDRQELKEGDECPLCFSVEHPFRQMDIKPMVDKAKEEYQKADKLVQALRQKERKLLQNENTISQELELLLGDEQKQKKGSIDSLREKLRKQEQRMSALIVGADQAQGLGLKARLETLEKQLQDWKQLQNHLNSLAQKIESEKEAGQQKEKAILKAKAAWDLLKSKEQDVSKIAVEQQDQQLQLTQQLNDTLQLYGYKFTVDTVEITFATLREQLLQHRSYTKAAQEEEKAMAVQQLQQTHLLEEQAKLEEKKALALEKYSLLSANLNQLQQQIDELLQGNTLVALRQALQTQELAVQQALEQTRQQHQQALQALLLEQQSEKEEQKRFKNYKQQYEKLEKELLIALKELGAYSSIEAALKDKLPKEEEDAYMAIQQRHEREQGQIVHSLEEVEAEIEKWHPFALNEAEENELETSFKETNEQYQQSLLRLGQIEEQYRQQQERKAQHARLLADIDQQRMEFNRWAQLNELIGQADGKKFRTFAQGLTLQKLVAIANEYLEKLSGRYFIHKREDADLELEIIDSYQADNRRSMYTLSGGESFLISLALAMGLSDLAGKNAQIHSLFIDEGFGTLDARSLDVALSTLENLQSVGKTIGVISHLKELKERIGVQIQVNKQSTGFSSLSVVA